METANLKSLMHDPDYYTKSFHVYAKKCSKFQVLSKWGDNDFPTMVVDKLARAFPADTQIKMLGVGSGSGEMDSKMAALIRPRFNAVRNTVVEPAAKQLEMYRDLVEGKKEDFAGIEFDFRQQTIDQYREKEKTDGGEPAKYHFISAIHSLYYAEDYVDTVRYLYDRLEEGGMFVIVCVASDSGFWNLWDRYTRFQDSVSRFLRGTHFKEVFSAQRFPYEESRLISRVDITDSFDVESEAGNLVVDFLVHVIGFREKASPELQKEVLEYLGSAECSERPQDGTVLFNNDSEVFVIQRQASPEN